MDNETKNTKALEWAPEIRAACPVCPARLEAMDACSLGAVGVCPECGELIRRTSASVELYPEADHAKAHPEVLAKLLAIQNVIQTAAMCGCKPSQDEHAGADTFAPEPGDDCVCGGGCGCHGKS